MSDVCKICDHITFGDNGLTNVCRKDGHKIKNAEAETCDLFELMDYAF